MIISTFFAHQLKAKQLEGNDSIYHNWIIALKIFDIALTIYAFYLYFKCNFGSGKKISISKKIIDFIFACCCNLLYVIYRTVVKC